MASFATLAFARLTGTTVKVCEKPNSRDTPVLLPRALVPWLLIRPRRIASIDVACLSFMLRAYILASSCLSQLYVGYLSRLPAEPVPLL